MRIKGINIPSLCLLFRKVTVTAPEALAPLSPGVWLINFLFQKERRGKGGDRTGSLGKLPQAGCDSGRSRARERTLDLPVAERERLWLWRKEGRIA